MAFSPWSLIVASVILGGASSLQTPPIPKPFPKPGQPTTTTTAPPPATTPATTPATVPAQPPARVPVRANEDARSQAPAGMYRLTHLEVRWSAEMPLSWEAVPVPTKDLGVDVLIPVDVLQARSPPPIPRVLAAG